MGEKRFMKKMLISYIVCMLMLGTIFFVGTVEINKEFPDSKQSVNFYQSGCYVLISENEGARVILVDNSGEVIWEKTGVVPSDAEKLENGNILITDLYSVIEVDINGVIVWQKMANSPFDAERLSNGNTLITEYDRVIEVDTAGSIVWQKTGLIEPLDGERLENGNTLIVESSGYYYGGRVIEVNTIGTIVWQYPLLPDMVVFSDAERLPNGDTLITDAINDRAIEVNTVGSIVWQKTGLNYPFDAERLSNGNTLITEYERVIEVDPVGSIVWEKPGLNHALDAEGFFTDPPSTPIIEGEIEGNVGVSYQYTFKTIDPNADNVFYYIDWGDNSNSGWIGPYPSDQEVITDHHWSKKGDYTIKCKVKDIIYAESDWATLEVTMPRNRALYNSLLLTFLERFPFLERLFQISTHTSFSL
jgi:uncharacterized protein (UPF0248 family)